mmetsp:Transcript_3130/g.12157  ORF Transcript_3130/g.12157 Transcript_3130/m.12157 type:complete len:107 (-) Transcript_3130:156-476(-)
MSPNMTEHVEHTWRRPSVERQATAEAPVWKHQLRMIVSSKAFVLCFVGVCCLNFVWCALKVYAELVDNWDLLYVLWALMIVEDIFIMAFVIERLWRSSPTLCLAPC